MKFVANGRNVAQVIKKEIRDHVIHDGTKAPMWFYLVHYMVRCCPPEYPRECWYAGLQVCSV